MLKYLTTSGLKQIQSNSLDLELVLNLVSDIVLIKDNQNNILFANKAACELLEKDSNEIVGYNADQIFSREDANKFYKDDLKIIESRKAIYKIIENITDKHGRRNLFITDKIPLVSDNKEVEKIIVIRKSLEKQSSEVKRLSHELKILRAKFDEFKYILTHDLLEPVRMISSFVELIEKLLAGYKIKDEKLKKYFSFVNDSCKKMKSIVLRTSKSVKKN
jgi:PAS domain S-box-containing protein